MSEPGRPPVQTAVTSTIRLQPAEWAVATWRPRQPIPRPAPRPFEFHRCLAQARSTGGLRGSTNPYFGTTTPCPRETLTPAEAHFWFLFMTEGADLAELTRRGEQAFTGEMSRDELRQRLRNRPGFLSIAVVATLAALLPPEDLVELLLDDELFVLDSSRYHHYHLLNLQNMLLDGFRSQVLPFLDDSALERLRQVARARIAPALWSQGTAPTLEQALGYRLAPLLGLHRELLTLVSGWTSQLFPRRGGYEEWRRLPREMIFGLGDPSLVESHMRRLGLLLRNETDGRAWLAHTETRALDYLRDSALGGPGHQANRLIETLCAVEAPAAARPLLELQLAGQATPALRRWFATQPGNAVAGLLPLAAGRGRLGDAVRHYLRELHRRGHTAVLEEQLKAADPAVASRVRRHLLAFHENSQPPMDATTTPGWLSKALVACHGPLRPLPDWVVIGDLPPLVIGERRLGDSQVTYLLLCLGENRPATPPPLARLLATHVAAPCRETFAWRLIEHWQCAGAPLRESWVLHAAAWFGGDASVLRLAGLIRDWSGAAGRHRAGVALECLQAVASPLALQQLTALSRQVRSRPLRQRVRELIDELARQRGLSRAELEDQAVPTLGFDAATGPRFDFGGRRFEAVLAPGPRLLLRDDRGRLRADLPAPGARDDRVRARQALADWRLLRRSLREVVREQTARLERAMISGQRWPMRLFQRAFLRQPVLAQLARLLLWGGYDDRGRLVRTFRVNDELTLVDAEEAPVSPTDLNSVRVVHPIELVEPQRRTWAAVWRDHELVAPFAQLGRRLYPLADGEADERLLTGFRGRRVPGLTLSSHVKAHDWQPAVLGSGRPGEAHAKLFRAARLLAVLCHPNVGAFPYPHHQSEQELQQGFFLPATTFPGEPIDPARAVPLGEVPPLIRSEVCELMAWLHGKGKE